MLHLILKKALLTNTVGPLIIESPWAKHGVSTKALEVLNDPLVVRMKL